MPTQRIVFLYGDDEFAMGRRLGEFEAMFDDPTSAEMNTARLEARTVPEDDLNNAINAMPFLARQRLVVLSNPSARYTTPPIRKKFFELLQKAPPSTQLVITETVELKFKRTKAEQEQEDDKHWLVKWMRKAGLGLERHALPPLRDMPGWITKQVSGQGGRIDGAAAARLAEMVGTDTRQAAQEIAKLLAYVNWARPVGMEDVQAVSIVSAEGNIFDLVDALAQGNGRLAQRSLHTLLEQEEPFGVWAMIIRQFRLLLLAREVMDQRGSVRDVEQALGVHRFVAEKVSGQARRFSLPVLEGIYHRLLEIDEQVKTGRVPLDVALEMLVGELAA